MQGANGPIPWSRQNAVKNILAHEIEGQEPPVTEAAKRKVTDWLNLQAHYPDRLVACFTTAEGVLTVLAEGEEEIEALYQGLSDTEAAQVVVKDPT